MCENGGRIRIRIGIILMPIGIRIQIWISISKEILIQIGIKTMPIHNTASVALLHRSCFVFCFSRWLILHTLFSFSHNTSYVELEPLYVVPSANITITFATDQENGVLLYVGKSNHITFTMLCSTFRTGRYVLDY
jgi:hypothetical protein